MSTYLLGPRRSALLTSSATMDKKSRTWSVAAPWLEKEDTHDMIQSGQREGCPGASLRAREVSWMIYEFVSMQAGTISEEEAYSDEELAQNKLGAANGE